MSVLSRAHGRRISLGRLHLGQLSAHWALQPHRFKALRCGRRFDKTEFAKTWIAQGLVQGEECAWFAPQHMTWSEVYLDLGQMLQPILDSSSRTPPVIRLSNGGRIDFWSLENAIAGRGRRYRRVVIDEAAFTKDGDNRSDDSMMALWEKGIKPTLFDYGGAALVCSNSAGRNPDNFFYNICTDPQYGFREFHATTLDNPLLPKRSANESVEDWRGRQARFHEDLRKDNDPLVYAQEYTAEFVDWSGVAFFSRGKLLVDNKPLPLPARCDAVFAVIDRASKTGTDNDATAVTFFAYDTLGRNLAFHLGLGCRADRRGDAGNLVASGLRSPRRTCSAVSCPPRLDRRLHRGQELGDGSLAASIATANARAPGRLEAHRDGQGRARDFCVRLCPSRVGQVHGPSLREDSHLQAALTKPPALLGREVSRWRPRGRPTRHLLLRCRVGARE